MVVYASPPVSGGGVVPTHAQLATFRTMRLPVSLELHELLATVNIPQADRLVTRPTDELPRICRVEMDAKDRTAAIFEVSGNTFVMVVYASPPLTVQRA